MSTEDADDAEERPWTPTREESFTEQRTLELVQIATPHRLDKLVEKHDRITRHCRCHLALWPHYPPDDSAVTAALVARSPFSVTSVHKIGSAGSGTLVRTHPPHRSALHPYRAQVRRYEEQLELLVFVSGLSAAGAEDYRAPFVDFMLEYLKHNLPSEQLPCEDFSGRERESVVVFYSEVYTPPPACRLRP